MVCLGKLTQRASFHVILCDSISNESELKICSGYTYLYSSSGSNYMVPEKENIEPGKIVEQSCQGKSTKQHKLEGGAFPAMLKVENRFDLFFKM